MKINALKQGSPEWLAYRSQPGRKNASDASAMMGASPYVTRTQLLDRCADPTRQPDITPDQQALFDKGHAAEAAVRPIIEEQFDIELFPVCGTEVADGIELSASFDGRTLTGDTIWEHKLWSKAKAQHVSDNGTVPVADHWQVVHQLLVSGAKRCIYTVSDGTADKMISCEVSLDDDDAQKLMAGWRQFDADLEDHVPSNHVATPEGASPDHLPALSVTVEGRVIATNLDQFRQYADQVLGSINRDLQTDQDFADAEATVKWCKEVESRIAATKDNVIGQMASVDEVVRTLDDVSERTRRIRLELDKLVKAEKTARKTKMVHDAYQKVMDHRKLINAHLGEYALNYGSFGIADMAASIKGLKSLASMHDALDTAVANAKIADRQNAESVGKSIAVIDEFVQSHPSLFPDRVILCHDKSPDDLRNLCKARVAEHEEAERNRLEAERERIRAEEQAKAEATQFNKKDHFVDANKMVDTRTADQVIEDITDDTDRDPYADIPSLSVGDINRIIAPLSISAAGLAELGIKPSGRKGASKLYEAIKWPHIREALICLIDDARLPETEDVA